MSRPRHRHRHRREISRAALTALAPVFRYSRSREAYVLRLIGDSVGPVLQVRPGRGAPPAPVADDAGHFKTGRFERAEPVTEQSSK